MSSSKSGLKFRRIAAVLLVILAALAAGAALGGLVLPAGPMTTLVGAVGIGTLLLEIVKSMPAAWKTVVDYCERGTGAFWTSVAPETASFLLQSALLSACLSAVALSANTLEDEPPISLASAVTLSHQMSGDAVTRDSPVRISIPFKADAKLTGGCQPSFDEEAQELAAGGAELLDSWAPALMACATSEHPVSIVVRGFATSSTFGGCPKDDKTLNLRLANTRADTVKQLLDGSLRRAAPQAASGVATVRVVAAAWPSFEAMERARPIVDSKGNVYDIQRGSLTRRVDVTVEGLGACAVESSVMDVRQRKRT